MIALGVVFGDIGTSPLYALRECFYGGRGLEPTPAAVYGVVSLIAWALVIVVTVKYVGFVLEADNRGEGGILALLALSGGRRRPVVVLLGLFGAALLYGDGVITPAISVLSAVEGLEVAAPALGNWVVPLTVVILLGLFLVQKRGTAAVGSVFGPVMLLWFVTIALLGAVEVVRHPAILGALNPWHGARFLIGSGGAGLLVLGAVVLAVTGAEALYADMGHFGRRPIRVAWLGLVFPSLLLNYLGQGALVARLPAAARNPFYLLAPRPLLYPLVGLATVATIVASQALISGAFSLSRQSIHLGYSPRLTVIHTSRSESGQIYVPEVNVALMVGCLLLVLGFRTSSGLGAAYGVAVTGTMAITTVLFVLVARERWGWSAARAGGFAAVFLLVDGAFLVANLAKVGEGGWVPLVIAGAVFVLMTTWKRGSELVQGLLARDAAPLERLLDELAGGRVPRVPGTAVFLSASPHGTPPVLLHHVRHNQALHERVVILSVATAEVPEVAESDRITSEPLGEGLYRVRATYGFMEAPNVPDVVARCCDLGQRANPERTTYYLGRARLLPTGHTPMARWRKYLYAFMARNARAAIEYFDIPADRVVELGGRLEL